MKKKYLLLLGLLSITGWLTAQVIYNEGSHIVIDSGAVLWTTGGLVNTSSASMTNGGTLSVDASLENNTNSVLKGDGHYQIGMDWINTADFIAGVCTLTFFGNTHSELTSSGDDFHHIRIDKSSNGQLQLKDDLRMTGNFSFLKDDNFVLLANSSFTLGSSSSIIGFDENNFFVSNGVGELRKEAMSNFTFPLGFSTTTYNPLSLIESGIVDRIAVRCLEQVWTEGSSGSPLTNVVDASWLLSEQVPGGSSLSMTAQWNASDELGSFDRSNCGIAHYTGTCWDLTQNQKGNAVGTDPYTIDRSNISSMGVYAIGGDPLLKPLRLSAQLLLEGPYASGGEMNDLLRQSGHLPTLEPFTALGYTHIEPGGGETTTISVLNTTGSNAIVDWVFVEIRTATANSTTVATRSALLQIDGDIVDLDGSSALNFGGIADGTYYVLIRSRNHVGIMSASSLSLSKTTTPLDFTTSTANALGGALSLKDLGDGFFAIYSGDYNGNGQVQNTDANNLILEIGTSGYKAGDLDLNGQVQNSELQTILIPNIGKGSQFDY